MANQQLPAIASRDQWWVYETAQRLATIRNDVLEGREPVTGELAGSLEAVAIQASELATIIKSKALLT